MRILSLYLSLIMIVSLFTTEVFAHEPGEQLIGSGVWKYLFFGGVIVCAGALLNWLISLLSLSQPLKHTLGWIVRGALAGITAYFVYHRFVE